MNGKLALTILLSICLSACAFLPVEEPVLPPPLLRAYDGADFTFAVVQKGDMQNYRDVSVNYVRAKQESVGFAVGDVLIESVHVVVGDTVEKGQILAELKRDWIISELKSAGYSMEVLNARLRHLDEERALDMDENEYQQRRGDLLSQVEIMNIRTEELSTLNEQRILRAGMDGSVTFVKSYNDGDYSEENARMVTLVDKSLSVFAPTSTSDGNLFEPGMTVEIKVSNDYYDALVVTSEDVNAHEETGKIYFMLTPPVADMRESAYGTIRLILDERFDVLFIPLKAVSTTEDESLVYLMEDGVRTVRSVVTGMSDGVNIEITEGLEEGEAVILD